MKEKINKNEKMIKKMKIFNSSSHIKIELYKLKKEIKQINYRDVIKLIINY